MGDIKLVFSLDYEIFGDGSGLTTREQCVPTRHLADILELHGFRLTIFAEVGQQIYFREHGVATQYEPVEQQLKELFGRGHDVQLHIHPMWFFAGPLVDGRVTLDGSLYDLSLLEPERIDSIVARSCQYLRELLSPIDPAYRPIAYRAGAWSMRRHRSLFDILARHGILIDSTIAPGACFNASYGDFDYTSYQLSPFWKEGPLIEVPILTRCGPLSARFYWNPQGVMTRRVISQFYKAPLARRGQSKLERLREILTRDYVIADFNLLSARQLARMILRYEKEQSGSVDALPVVLIGHSKSSYFADSLFDLFHLLRQSGAAVGSSTLAQLAPALTTAVRDGLQ